MTARGAVAAAVLLGAVVAPSAPAAACAGVRVTGAWTVFKPPADTVASDVAVVPAPGGDVAFAYRTGVGENRDVLRGTGNGCTWTSTLSLDGVGAQTDLPRLDPAYRVVAVTAVAVPGKQPVVYVLADDDGESLGVSLPVVTYASTDGGAHWTLHQPSQSDLAGDYPRCGRDSNEDTRLRVGTDPATVYLRCRVSGVGDIAFVGAQCTDAYYVTHDGGATWHPVRARLRDFSAVAANPTADGLGCGRIVIDPMPSRVAPKTVWDIDPNGTDNISGISVSRDDGATFAQFARTNGPAAAVYYTVAESRGRTFAAVYNHTDIYLATAAGTLAKLPRPVSRHGVLDHLAGVAFVTDRKGAVRLLACYVTKNPVGADALLYDPAARRWRAIDVPGKRDDLQAAWNGDGTPMRVVSAPGSTSVWLATWDGYLVRYAT